MGSMLGGMMGGGMMGGLMGGGGSTGATPGDPGGELTAGGSSGGGGGILNTLQGLVKSAGSGQGKGTSAPSSPATASDIQTKALRNIVGLVSSAFSSKQSANRLNLANQMVSEGNS